MAVVSAQSRLEKLLLEAARKFNSTLEYEELIELTLELMLTAVNCEGAMLFRVDHNRTDMRVRFMNRRDNTMTVVRREYGRLIKEWAQQYAEPSIIDTPDDSRLDPDLLHMIVTDVHAVLSVPLIGKGQMIGVVMAINPLSGSFSAADLDILTGLNNQIAVAIDNAHLYREVRREALEKNLLLEVGKTLAATLDTDQVMHAIMNSLQQVVAYNAGGVFLTDPQAATIVSLFTIGYPLEEAEKLQLKIGQGLIGTVAKTGEVINVKDVTADVRYVEARRETRSEMVVPIMLNDRVLGVINLESDDFAAYGRTAVNLVSAFAAQAALAIERANLYQRTVESRKLDEQLNIARQIQQSFLPAKNPAVTGYDISGTNISSGQVGGDYYDFIKIIDGHWGIAIGDVSGKGMAAALIMASFRASLIAEIRNNYSIRTICAKVNSLLCESMEPGNFVTAVYGVLDARNHIFTFSNCGHNLPFLLRANGSVEYLQDGGPIFGVTPSAAYDERALVIGVGDILVLYTDGVTEVFDDKGVEFGLDRLVEVVQRNRKLSAQQIQEAIHTRVTSGAAADHMYDDFTMIVIKRTG